MNGRQDKRRVLPYHAIGYLEDAIAGIGDILRLAKEAERALADRNTHRVEAALLKIQVEALECKEALASIRTGGGE